MGNKEIYQKGLEFARNEYSKRQQKCLDGDPRGFALLFNSKSLKFSTVALQSKKLSTLSENTFHVYNIYSNGSCEKA